jgi:aminodeoxyfutalosine synthase
MSTSTLERIRKNVEAGDRLSAADGEYLFSPAVDLHAVGELADLVRQRKNGDAAYYNLNLHINPTNVCIYRCALCAYSRDEDDRRAYTMSPADILARAKEAADAGCTELHIVGGAHPQKPFDWYLGIIHDLHAAFPQLHLKAWTAVEIDHFAHIADRPARSILEDLTGAGLGSMPGGGAEIFDPQIRAEICPNKADAKTWLAIYRTAHELGLRTNASMLYGHIESIEHRIGHLLQLRDLQDVTGGFQAFVPLKFHPENTPLGTSPAECRLSLRESSVGPDLAPRKCYGGGATFAERKATFVPRWQSSPLDDLRMVAISRLMLDNFDHIKAYWISLGVGTAQVALAYGADDLDGTVRQERIHHDAGATSPESLSIDQLRALITEAGREPIERDSLYRRVVRGNKAAGHRCVDLQAP